MRTVSRQHGSVAASTNPWLMTAKKLTQPTLRLFCFAHAGGSAAVFHHWHKQLPESIEVVAIQLPGRGHRMQEPCINDYETLVAAICDAIADQLDRPFAFFGHSMGAMLAYGVAQQLRAQGRPLPRQLFVSGCRPPQCELGRNAIHHLDQSAFFESLAQLNGTPAELLANRELMELMEPMLRADFKVVETRSYREQEPLPLPIAVFGGKDDNRVSHEHLQAWQQHTQGGFWVRTFPGDHFYYLEQTSALLHHIGELLCINIKAAI